MEHPTHNAKLNELLAYLQIQIDKQLAMQTALTSYQWQREKNLTRVLIGMRDALIDLLNINDDVV